MKIYDCIAMRYTTEHKMILKKAPLIIAGVQVKVQVKVNGRRRDTKKGAREMTMQYCNRNQSPNAYFVGDMM